MFAVRNMKMNYCMLSADLAFNRLRLITSLRFQFISKFKKKINFDNMQQMSTQSSQG